ncbi:MAG TPA: YciI family protein [Burkholderiales bacterium]|nr:YciI family protein [Burkholderiales bacterium]
MQYMLMLYETAEDLAHRPEGRNGEYWAGWAAYVEALRKSGIVRAGAGLEPPATAATLRTRRGARKVQDGPFADAKEQLGGFFVVETASLEEALEWAARAPCASTGGVEVRPVMPPQYR